MKNTFSLLGLCFCFLTTCAPEKEPENALTTTNELLSIKSTRGDDIFDVLYEQLKEQKPELVALEQQIEEVDREKDKALAEYRRYNAKNENYYYIAHQRLSGIKDSLLRNSIEVLVNKSHYAYEQDNAAMSLAIAQLESKSTQLHDQQEALKIVLTNNLLQKYQKKQLPDYSEYKKIIDRYQATLKTADSLLQTK